MIARCYLNDGGGESSRNSNVAGRWLYASGSLQGKTGDLIYQFRMQAGVGAGRYGARTVVTPALDDVTLTYYLPSTQILLSEIQE